MVMQGLVDAAVVLRGLDPIANGLCDDVEEEGNLEAQGKEQVGAMEMQVEDTDEATDGRPEEEAWGGETDVASWVPVKADRCDGDAGWIGRGPFDCRDQASSDDKDSDDKADDQRSDDAAHGTEFRHCESGGIARRGGAGPVQEMLQKARAVDGSGYATRATRLPRKLHLCKIGSFQAGAA